MKVVCQECGNQYEVECPKCHRKASLEDPEFNTSIDLRKRFSQEPAVLYWLRRVGGTIFLGGLGTSTFAAGLEWLSGITSSVSYNDLVYTVIVSLLGGLL